MIAVFERNASVLKACNKSRCWRASPWSGWLRAATIAAGISTATAAAADDAGTSTNQAGVISVTGVERTGVHRHALLQPNWINYQDCREGATDALVFKLAISGGTNQTIETWVSRGGPNCVDANIRLDGVSCMKLNDLSSTSASPQVKTTVAELLSKFPIMDECGETSTSRSPVPLNFFFLVNPEKIGMTTDYAIWSDGGFDLWGPSPPSKLAILSGDNELDVSFSGNPGDAADLGGYHVYVDNGELDGSDGLTTTTTSGGTTSSGEHVSNCDSGVVHLSCKPESHTLVSGAIPDEKSYAKYQQSGRVLPEAAEGNITNLENYKAYVIAMAAYDKVGNLSPLSDLVCGVPEEAVIILRANDCAGGLTEQGCGFCSLGGRGGGSWAALASGSLIVVGFAARRRRRERERGRQ
jgi:hypothetical protein